MYVRKHNLKDSMDSKRTFIFSNFKIITTRRMIIFSFQCC